MTDPQRLNNASNLARGANTTPVTLPASRSAIVVIIVMTTCLCAVAVTGTIALCFLIVRAAHL